MYVVIEGIDCVGKSTQINLLKDVYKEAIFTKEPYKQNIKDFILNNDFDVTTQAYLFLADRELHMRKIIEPNCDKLIISDRSFISGNAYCDNLFLNEINNKISKTPDLVIVLTIDKIKLIKRLLFKELDVIENQGIEKLLKIQDRIIDISKNYNHLIVDCDLDKYKIRDIIKIKIDEGIT